MFYFFKLSKTAFILAKDESPLCSVLGTVEYVSTVLAEFILSLKSDFDLADLADFGGAND